MTCEPVAADPPLPGGMLTASGADARQAVPHVRPTHALGERP